MCDVCVCAALLLGRGESGVGGWAGGKGECALCRRGGALLLACHFRVRCFRARVSVFAHSRAGKSRDFVPIFVRCALTPSLPLPLNHPPPPPLLLPSIRPLPLPRPPISLSSPPLFLPFPLFLPSPLFPSFPSFPSFSLSPSLRLSVTPSLPPSLSLPCSLPPSIPLSLSHSLSHSLSLSLPLLSLSDFLSLPLPAFSLSSLPPSSLPRSLAPSNPPREGGKGER